jgi:iron complex transport system permease protein
VHDAVTDHALRPAPATPALVAALAARFGTARRRSRILLATSLVALAAAVVAGLAFGSVSLPLGDVAGVILHRLGVAVPVTWAPATETIVFELRVPRVLAAIAVGAGLSVAGATFQGLLRNPLADPYVLGTASGAALGAAVALLLPVHVVLVGLGLVQLLAFGGAVAAVTLVYRLARVGPAASMTSVLLTGYAVGSLLAAGLALTMYLAGSTLRQIFFYLLGSFSLASWPQLVVGLPVIVIGCALIIARGRSLNAMLLGEDTAAHLGLNVRRERLMMLGLATLVTAAAVAIAGLIGFVGLIVPHLVRLLVGPNARSLLPLSALAGGSFLCFADLVARLPGELPVGIVTAVVGAPFFLYLLRRYRSAYEL